MRQSSYEIEPAYDEDPPGGPTHQPSVRPGAAHLPVSGQPTIYYGDRGKCCRRPRRAA